MYEFKYVRPTSIRQAVNMLGKDSEAKILAGGHSILPVMKLRLAKPSQLLDIVRIEGLNTIELRGRSIVIGATARHVAVRHRGTLGGSLANNDPNADYPAAVLGLGATIITSKRRITADDYFKGMFETALESDEIITKVSFPLAKKAAYQKFKHPASGFALVGVFVSKRGSDIRVAVTGAGSNGVFRVKSFEEALKKRFSPKSIEGMTIPADGMNSDIHGSAEYRAHLVSVLARRALAAA
jgi:carbon-monoxide dehydrogenase medium subunit